MTVITTERNVMFIQFVVHWFCLKFHHYYFFLQRPLKMKLKMKMKMKMKKSILVLNWKMERKSRSRGGFHFKPWNHSQRLITKRVAWAFPHQWMNPATELYKHTPVAKGALSLESSSMSAADAYDPTFAYVTMSNARYSRWPCGGGNEPAVALPFLI